MAPQRLGLIIRGHPYARRAARTDLDLALAAAALDWKLDLFFIGPALLQLAADREPAGALLAGGLRGWSALPELAETRMFAERDWLKRCERDGIRLQVAVTALAADAMRAAWARCDRVLVA